MQRRRFPPHVAGAIAALLAALAAVVTAPDPSVAASTTGTTVTATVPSATTLVPGGCPALASNVTHFGIVLPGSSVTTSVDCDLVFGSTNDTSMLLVYQGDGGGDAMMPGPSTGAGLLGYWPLNGTASDLSANANALVPASAPDDPVFSSSSGVPGRGSYLSFGDQDLATIPSHAAYNVTSFTVDTWLRMTPASSNGDIVARQSSECLAGAGPCQWAFAVHPDGTAAAEMMTGPASHHVAHGSVVVNDDSWHHLALTMDDTAKELRLYVDGTLSAVDTTWTTGSVQTGAIPITVRDMLAGAPVTDRKIDELRFQSGVRTALDIRSYYLGRIADYSSATNGWGTTPSTTRMFGACLRVADDGASTNVGTWTPDASCDRTDGPAWKPIVATNVTAGSKVAAGPFQDNDAHVGLRFGLRIPLTQPPGLYTAPVAFEVAAPDIP